MLIICIKILWYTFLVSITSALITEIVLNATTYIILAIIDFLYGGSENDTEE